MWYFWIFWSRILINRCQCCFKISLQEEVPITKVIIFFPNGIFAHSRLSIQDLSSNANQPLVDSSGKYCIVYNGEIYNSNSLKTELCRLGYKFSTNSDTEVILNGYIEWGVKIFQNFLACLLLLSIILNPTESFVHVIPSV